MTKEEAYNIVVQVASNAPLNMRENDVLREALGVLKELVEKTDGDWNTVIAGNRYPGDPKDYKDGNPVEPNKEVPDEA